MIVGRVNTGGAVVVVVGEVVVVVLVVVVVVVVVGVVVVVFVVGTVVLDFGGTLVLVLVLLVVVVDVDVVVGTVVLDVGGVVVVLVVVVGAVVVLVVAMVPTVGSGSPDAGCRPVGVGLGSGWLGGWVVAAGVTEVVVVSPAEWATASTSTPPAPLAITRVESSAGVGVESTDPVSACAWAAPESSARITVVPPRTAGVKLRMTRRARTTTGRTPSSTAKVR